MRLAAVVIAMTLAIPAISLAEPIKKKERDYQDKAFRKWWNAKLVWKFDKLPTKGKVPDHRIPYSGHDYPDRRGGTATAMAKYDRAFHRGYGRASGFERHDTTAFQEPTTVRVGLFRFRTRTVMETPHWHGHCNGWTAAAIRHAEPQKSVVRNGVRFTPADIKGMLAEIYMYNESEFLGGEDYAINPGTFHVVLTNWLGRGSYPVGLETTLGKEAWNYPAYRYEYTTRKINSRRVGVEMRVIHARSTKQEYNKSPKLWRRLYFHYALDLNENGEVTGGYYYRGSNRMDMLWIPMAPVQGGEKGNERGNPHLDVKTVLSIWRESVPQELRDKWPNVDPTPEDRILSEAEKKKEAAEAAKKKAEAAAKQAEADAGAAPANGATAAIR